MTTDNSKPAFDTFPPDRYECTNLDAMTHLELREIMERSNTPRLIKRYCLNKMQAILDRLAGRIQAAQKSEAICERIYNQLDANLKW